MAVHSSAASLRLGRATLGRESPANETLTESAVKGVSCVYPVTSRVDSFGVKCGVEFKINARNFVPKKGRWTVMASGEQTTEAEVPPVEKSIDVTFLAPEEGTDSSTLTIKSGEKVLRNFMIESKLPLYDFYGTIMNCGGGGTCGTCLVEIVEGEELLSSRTSAEDKYLKNKPKNWRLACQTILGDGSNAGQVIVQRLPQKKKK